MSAYQTEFLDLYNACGDPLGRTKPRALVHRDGDWHKTFHCWIIYKDAAGYDTIIFQKRSANVEVFPGKFDITAAGHYRAGEGVEGGLRELYEELGVAADASQLISAGVRVCVDDCEPNRRNHELQEVYFLKDDRALQAYSPDREEVEGVVAVRIDLLLQLLTGQLAALTVPGMMYHSSSPDSGAELCDVTICAADFIPTIDHYYHRAPVLAQRILNHEQYVWI